MEQLFKQNSRGSLFRSTPNARCFSRGRSLIAFTLLLSQALTSIANAETVAETSLKDVVSVTRAQSQKTLEKLITMAPTAKVSSREDRIGPSLLLKLNLRLEGESASEQAHYFIRQFSNLWGHLEVKVDRIEERRSRQIIHLVGSIDGVPLLNQQSKLSIVDGVAQHLSNGLGALSRLIKAKINEEEASKVALQSAQRQGLRLISVKRFAVSYEPGIAHEVFEIHLSALSELKTWRVLVDGQDGAIINVAAGEKR